jgi:hypothetical protein
MELLLQNTTHGLLPMYDSDYDEKKKLKIGETYRAKIRLARNLDFHRKYFALINCAWEYQSEKRQAHFKNSTELFRKSVQIAAGHCEPVYSIKRKEWIEESKSISFENMDEAEFADLYSKVKDVLFDIFLTHITQDEFERNLINF